MMNKRIRFWEPISHQYKFGVVIEEKMTGFIVKVGDRKYFVHNNDEWRVW